MAPVNPLSDEELDALANYKPSLTYGQAVQAPPEDFVPAHVGFDKKVLLFQAYFKQTVHEAPHEFYCVRPVKIFYYLEDDSIAVVEPVVENRYASILTQRRRDLLNNFCLDSHSLLHISHETVS